MHTYDSTVASFIDDTKNPDFTDRLQKKFYNSFGTGVSESEIKSWAVSLKALANVLEAAAHKPKALPQKTLHQ
jgi:hypothetical protein